MAEQMSYQGEGHSSHIQGKISRFSFMSDFSSHSQDLKLETLARSINASLAPQDLHFNFGLRMIVIFDFFIVIFPFPLVIYAASRQIPFVYVIVILLVGVYFVAKRYRPEKEIGIASISSYYERGGEKHVCFPHIERNGETRLKTLPVSSYDLFYILPLPVDIDAVIDAAVHSEYGDVPIDVAILTLYVKIDSFFRTEMFILHEDLAHDPNFRFTWEQQRKLHVIRKKVAEDIANDPIFRLTPEQEQRFRAYEERRKNTDDKKWWHITR